MTSIMFILFRPSGAPACLLMRFPGADAPGFILTPLTGLRPGLPCAVAHLSAFCPSDFRGAAFFTCLSNQPIIS